MSIIKERGGAEELAVAERLAESGSDNDRAVAAKILGGLGSGDYAYPDECLHILAKLLRDPVASVVAAAAEALGERVDARAAPLLVELARSPDPSIRLAVAKGLRGTLDEPTAVEALVRLARDQEVAVRDWATFSLAWESVRGPGVSEVLRERATDHDREVRGEALVGMVRHGDPEARQLVLHELREEFCGDWVLEAATVLADPTFYPELQRLHARTCAEDRERFAESFSDAFRACDPRQQVEES